MPFAQLVCTKSRNRQDRFVTYLHLHLESMPKCFMCDYRNTRWYVRWDFSFLSSELRRIKNNLCRENMLQFFFKKFNSFCLRLRFLFIFIVHIKHTIGYFISHIFFAYKLKPFHIYFSLFLSNIFFSLAIQREKLLCLRSVLSFLWKNRIDISKRRKKLNKLYFLPPNLLQMMIITRASQ